MGRPSLAVISRGQGVRFRVDVRCRRGPFDDVPDRRGLCPPVRCLFRSMDRSAHRVHHLPCEEMQAEADEHRHNVESQPVSERQEIFRRDGEDRTAHETENGHVGGEDVEKVGLKLEQAVLSLAACIVAMDQLPHSIMPASSIPPELIIQIGSFLATQELCDLSLACRETRRILLRDVFRRILIHDDNVSDVERFFASHEVLKNSVQ